MSLPFQFSNYVTFSTLRMRSSYNRNPVMIFYSSRNIVRKSFLFRMKYNHHILLESFRKMTFTLYDALNEKFLETCMEYSVFIYSLLFLALYFAHFWIAHETVSMLRTSNNHIIFGSLLLFLIDYMRRMGDKRATLLFQKSYRQIMTSLHHTLNIPMSVT